MSSTEPDVPIVQAWQPHSKVASHVLLAKIAVGGMAEIWLARQSGLKGFERLVVIKRIADNFSADAEFVEMFLDEARIAAQLNHPHVVQILELGEFAGAYYIVMEYLNGENLASIARTAKKQEVPLPVAYSVRIIAQAAEGLAHAHEKTGLDGQPLRIVHRDVSPQNIIVTYDGGVKVLDFGIAKAANRSSHTVGRQFKGKLSYMSPEQAKGVELDPRSDVFSLGIVLYEAITGTRLFQFDDIVQAVRTVTSGPPIPPPSERNSKVPPELDTIVARALARPIEERYQSARELCADLEGWLKKAKDAPTTAEISAYMKGLFADKIEERNKLIGSALSGDLTPSQMPQALLQGTQPTMPGRTPALRRTEVADFKPRRGPAPYVVLGAVALLAAIGIGLWWSSGSKPEPVAEPVPIRAPPPAAPSTPLPVASAPAPVATPPPPVPQPAAAAPTPAPSPRPAPPSPLDSVRGERTRPAHPRERAMGKLTLITTPWAHVYLGSKQIGDTPLLETAVPAGTLLLRLENPEKNVKSTIQVEVPAGKAVTMRLRL